MTNYTLPLDYFPIADSGFVLTEVHNGSKPVRYEIRSLGAGGGVHNSALSKSYILKVWNALKAEAMEVV